MATSSTKQMKKFLQQSKILTSTTSKTQQPNAFLSFRITDQRILDHARQIQEEIISKNPLLSEASVSIAKLHVTLMVFVLNTDEDKQRARQSLVEIFEQINNHKLVLPRVTFTGLAHFRNQVLFMNPVPDTHLESLTRIAEICREIYHKNGILTTDKRPFKPHLTLFKLSKARALFRQGVKKIDQCWSEKYTDYHFGVESFRSLQLCNMLAKQDDGYYEIFHEQHLGEHSNVDQSKVDVSIETMNEES